MCVWGGGTDRGDRLVDLYFLLVFHSNHMLIWLSLRDVGHIWDRTLKQLRKVALPCGGGPPTELNDITRL